MLKTEEGEDIANISSTGFSALVSGVFRLNPSTFLDEKNDLQKCKTANMRGDFFFFKKYL